MTNAAALAHAQNAERGNMRSIGAMLRALVEGTYQTLAGAPNKLETEAGLGITSGTGTVYRSGVVKVGGIITTQILIDLTGLTSADSDLDVIGVEDTTAACHIGRITAARNGTILGGTLKCLEAPASLTDIHLLGWFRCSGL